MNRSGKPRPKVAAAGIAGALATVVVFALSQAGIVLPAEVVAALVTLVAFGAGYLKTEA